MEAARAIKRTDNKTAGIGDEAVLKATGRTWPEWMAVLDKDGASKMTHQQIVALARDRHGVGAWWQQAVTVGYEQARGLRGKHEMPDGYQVSASKTVAVPVAQLYAAWADEAARAKWLGRRSLRVRKATPKKSMRMAWGRGQSSVSVNFYAKGKDKSTVQLEHSRLPSAADGEKMKEFWRKAMEKLKGALEG